MRPNVSRHSLINIPMLALLAVALAVYTFLNISGNLPPAGQSPQRIWLLLLANVGVLLALILTLARRLRGMLSKGDQPFFKSRLQKRVMLSFITVAILPTLVVSVFSALFFNFGVKAWFNERVDTAVEESLMVAEAYLNEHRENIRLEALSMASDINRFSSSTLASPSELSRFVSAQADRRQLTEVVVFQHNRIIAQGRLSFALAFESLPTSTLQRAEGGEVVILHDEAISPGRVRALVELESPQEAYLLVGRLVDEKVISHMEKTQGAVNEYRRLKKQLRRLQLAFSGVFVSLSLVLLLAAVWYALVFSGRLTTPIMRLASAAERVRAGDYSGRVEQGMDHDEISSLTRAFNRMVDQLQTQRSELISANRELDARRHFSEAVLGGVSAGVIALDADKHTTLSNRSAALILYGNQEEVLVKRQISEILPGIQELLVEAETRGNISQGSISLPRGQSLLTLHVRVTVERSYDKIIGYIVTFDDISPLVAAQRNAAWSDVARRVAHEIKNPLTPIALSAERLKRKYGKQLTGEDAETFNRYIDTISRHAADIGRMVEEFVAFARMPGAMMRDADMVQLCKRVVFSEQVAHPTITYRLNAEVDKIILNCDERQISQVLTNVIKNAAEAIEGIQVDSVNHAGKIEISIKLEGEYIRIFVADNGPGFPPDKIDSMLEPYVTTRSKGTGLGLAIVKKIVEEHKGTLTLANNPTGGALVMLSFLQQCDINAASD